MMPTAKNPVETTRKSFRIVELLAARDGGGVSELADALSLSKATVHHHLSTLEELGYVVRLDDTYHVGSRFLSLAGAARNRTGLHEAAADIVDELAATTGERVHTAVYESGYAVVTDTATGEHDPHDDLEPGDRLPLHSTAAGKAILAQLDTDTVESVYQAYGTESFTDKTITDWEELTDELRMVRQQGLAFTRGEHHPDHYGVAAPLGVDDGTVASLTVSGPKERIGGKSLQQDVAGLIVSASKRIRHEF
jgi:DNA-binding IclR family transcriptional regulator